MSVSLSLAVISESYSHRMFSFKAVRSRRNQGGNAAPIILVLASSSSPQDQVFPRCSSSACDCSVQNSHLLYWNLEMNCGQLVPVFVDRHSHDSGVC
eukprot:5117357-Amphidinium_carterae.2